MDYGVCAGVGDGGYPVLGPRLILAHLRAPPLKLPSLLADAVTPPEGKVCFSS